MWTARNWRATRPDAEYFAMIGSLTGHTLEPVASVTQDYGGRLAYGGKSTNPGTTKRSLALRQAAGRDIDLASPLP